MNKGKLYLIPTIISEETTARVLSPAIIETLPHIKHFLVENVRTTRRFLSSLKIYKRIEELNFQQLDKDTPTETLPELFLPIENGEPIAVLSESGCPGIADPGSIAVAYAHKKGIQVIPLVGPSSLLLALMASGLNGQKFCFHGYLPIESKGLSSTLRDLERESKTKNQTQIFIETPYRNNSMLQALLKNLSNPTMLCIAYDITGNNESIQTQSVKEWKQETPTYDKLPAVFLFLSR